jgi:hypothetical protein
MLAYTHGGNTNDFAQLFNRKAVAFFQKLDNTVPGRVIIKNDIHNALKNNIKKRFCKLVSLKINYFYLRTAVSRKDALPSSG